MFPYYNSSLLSSDHAAIFSAPYLLPKMDAWICVLGQITFICTDTHKMPFQKRLQKQNVLDVSF